MDGARRRQAPTYSLAPGHFRAAATPTTTCHTSPRLYISHGPCIRAPHHLASSSCRSGKGQGYSTSECIQHLAAQPTPAPNPVPSPSRTRSPADHISSNITINATAISTLQLHSATPQQTPHPAPLAISVSPARPFHKTTRATTLYPGNPQQIGTTQHRPHAVLVQRHTIRRHASNAHNDKCCNNTATHHPL